MRSGNATIKARIIKILFIIPKAQQGGAETQLLYLLKGINKKRFGVCLGFLYPCDEIKDEFNSIPGVEVVNFNKKQRFDFHVFSRIAKFIREKNIDIVHSFLGSHNAYLPAIIAGTKVIPVGGIMSSYEEKIPLLKRTEKFTISKWFTKLKNLVLVSCSYSGMQVYLDEGFPKESVYTIPNGINYEKFSKGNKHKPVKEFHLQNKFVIGTVGRLSEEKNQEQLIIMFNELAKEYKNIVLLLVGGGPLMDHLKGLAKELGLEKRVIFTGNRKDVPDLLAAMNIFVLPSLTEGWPNALGEAMSAGLATISYPVGDVALVVKNNINGVISRNNMKSLKEEIVTLMRNKKKIKQLGINAKETIRDNFSVEKMVQSYESFYLDLVKKTRAGRDNTKSEGA